MDKELIERIKILINEKYITRRKHPELDLYILNYTNKCQFDDAWEPATEMCRGLIVDNDWNIVANCFPKFFNLGERIEYKDLPDSIPRITEKIEGFFGILISENGKPAITTRGTFTSPMAIWATSWIRSTGLVMEDFMSNFTYIFEIIEPMLCREQGLIIDYGSRAECVLLAVRNTKTGIEIDHVSEAINLGLPYAEEYIGTLEDAIAQMPIMDVDDGEGFVCKYSNGMRIKLKSDEYKRLHRTLKGLSPKRILNVLIEDGYEGLEEMLEGVPDESYVNVRTAVEKIDAEKNRLITDGQQLCDSTKHLSSRQEKAKVINGQPCSGIAFAILDNRDYEKIALKHVRKYVTKLIDSMDKRKT